VVVVHYGSVALVRGCVASLAGCAEGVEVVVVDHAAKPLAEAGWGLGNGLDSGVLVRRPVENGGYGTGCNVGAEGCSREFLLFLNNDVLLTAGTVEVLVAALDADPKASVAGPQLVDVAGVPSPTVHRLPSPWRLLMENVPVGRLLPCLAALEGNSTVRQPHRGCAVEAVLGAAFLVRTKVFEELGGFDPRYFHFAEEDDLFRRIQDRGEKVVFVPEPRVVHVGSGASEEIPIETLDRWKADGFLRYAAKHHGADGRRRTRRALLLGARLRWLAASLPGALGSRERVRRFAALVTYLRTVGH